MAKKAIKVDFDESNLSYNIWIAHIIMKDYSVKLEDCAFCSAMEAMHHYNQWVNSETWRVNPNGGGWLNDLNDTKAFGLNAIGVKITNLIIINNEK